MRHGADTLMDDYERNVFRPDERATPPKGEPAPVLKTSDPVWHCVVCGAITQKSHEHKYQEILEQTRKQERDRVLDELAEPTIRASEEAEQNGDYVSQACYEDVLKWIAAIRQQEGKP